MANKPAPIELKRLSPFIDPFLMNSGPASCLVGENGKSIYMVGSGRKLNFELISPLAQGVELIVKVGRFDVVATLSSDEQAYQKAMEDERLERQAKLKQESREREARLQKQASDFNRALKIPFLWVPDIKVVMSGLSENSCGNGMNRRTVHHVRVLETYRDGRFIRNKGDFLCAKDNSKHQGYSEPKTGDVDLYQVDCKQCIKAAQRFSK